MGAFVGFEEREVTPLKLGQALPVHLRLVVEIRQQDGHVVHEHREAAGREVEGGLAQRFGYEVRVSRAAVLDGAREQAEGAGRMAELDEGARRAFPVRVVLDRRAGAFSQ